MAFARLLKEHGTFRDKGALFFLQMGKREESQLILYIDLLTGKATRFKKETVVT